MTENINRRTPTSTNDQYIDGDAEDEEKEAEEKELTKFQQALPQFLAVGVKNILLFGYGMTLGFPTIVIPAIQGGEGRESSTTHDIILNRDEISWFSSINLLCVPLGCIFSGIFTQPIGKRMAMQIVNIPILIAWLLYYFSTNIFHLYAGLCLSGLSGGLMEAPVLTYVAEVTQPQLRGMLAATGSAFVILGIFVQFLLGTCMKWRTIAAISAIFPIISAITLFFIPESPHWLIRKGYYDRAKKSLQWLRGWVPFEKVEQEYNEIYNKLVINKMDNEMAADDPTAQKHKQSAFMNKFIPYTKKSFLVPYALVSATFFMGHFSGKTSLQTYAVQIFHTLKAPIDKYYATVLLGAAELFGTLVCVVCIHYTGKRPLVFVSAIGCGLCFLGTATYARFLDLVPGVNVENVVANVSLLDLNRANIITETNVTEILVAHFKNNINFTELLEELKEQEEQASELNENAETTTFFDFQLNEELQQKIRFLQEQKQQLTEELRRKQQAKIEFYNVFPGAAYRTRRRRRRTINELPEIEFNHDYISYNDGDDDDEDEEDDDDFEDNKNNNMNMSKLPSSEMLNDNFNLTNDDDQFNITDDNFDFFGNKFLNRFDLTDNLMEFTTANYSEEYEDILVENISKTNKTILLAVQPLDIQELLSVIPADIVLAIPNVKENRFLWVPLTLLISAAMFAHMGIKLIPWMLIGEIFPANVRSGASGISGGTGYLFGFLANKLFLRMLATMTLPGTFWFYSSVSLVGAVILYFVLPETEGRTLLEIEEHYGGGKKLTNTSTVATVTNNNSNNALNVNDNNIENGQSIINNNNNSSSSRRRPPPLTNYVDHITAQPPSYTETSLHENNNLPQNHHHHHHHHQNNNNNNVRPNFDIKNWDSNRIFQQHLNSHNNQQPSARIPKDVNNQNNNNGNNGHGTNNTNGDFTNIIPINVQNSTGFGLKKFIDNNKKSNIITVITPPLPLTDHKSAMMLSPSQECHPPDNHLPNNGNILHCTRL